MPATDVKLSNVLRDEYQSLFDKCAILPQCADEVATLARSLVRNQARYEGGGASLGVPWYWVAVVRNMEFSQSLAMRLVS